MKKALIFILIAVVLCGCSAGTGWSKKDFRIYDENGKVIDSLHVYSEPSQHVCLGGMHCDECKDIDKTTATTHRGVAIGDDAIEALSKYDLTHAYYYTSEKSEKLTDLETTINENERVQISITLNEDYENIDRAERDPDFLLSVSFSVVNGTIDDYYVIYTNRLFHIGED